MIKDIKTTELDGYECCFCKRAIQESRNDPVDLTIVLNEDVIEKTGASQSFYAHINCLRESLHQDIRGYCIKKREIPTV